MVLLIPDDHERGGQRRAGWGLGGEGSVCEVCPRPLAPFDPCWERQNTQVFPLTSVDGTEDVGEMGIGSTGEPEFISGVDETAWPPHSSDLLASTALVPMLHHCPS